jgi:hypothetical protein
VLGIITLSIVFIGLINSTKKGYSSLYSFILSKEGEVCFSNDSRSYQLLDSSRVSFLGCWLILASKSAEEINLNIDSSNSVNQRYKIKKMFVFRDSLSGTDFSRICQVLRNLA